MTAVRRWIVWSGIVSLTALASPALGGPASLTAAQLARLDLGTYPRWTAPPDFSLRTPEGRIVSLAGLHGKVVVLNFWATWCRECRAEMAAFETLHRRFSARGLVVVGVNMREGAPAAQGYARELGLTFPLVLDPDGTVSARYGVVGLPTTFLIGRDGRAVGLAVGVREWASATAVEIAETLLAEPAREANPAGEAGPRGTRP
ncbi:MAG TPA: TlpA disulfide reductase family protein [Methylomirabilota bacterium]